MLYSATRMHNALETASLTNAAKMVEATVEDTHSYVARQQFDYIFSVI